MPIVDEMKFKLQIIIISLTLSLQLLSQDNISGIIPTPGRFENLKAALIAEILAQPQVIVHRDYHSRNLMQDQADHTRLGVIDFQDAVVGSYTYDLVSLVRDAYVEWPESQITSWVQDCWQLQKQPRSYTLHILRNP